MTPAFKYRKCEIVCSVDLESDTNNESFQQCAQLIPEEEEEEEEVVMSIKIFEK